MVEFIFLGFCLFLFCLILACETYAMRNPGRRFTIWWRKHFLYHDEENRFD